MNSCQKGAAKEERRRIELWLSLVSGGAAPATYGDYVVTGTYQPVSEPVAGNEPALA